MNYYKRHIGDYAAKAGHLTPLEHGVYGLLIDAYYNREEAPTKAEAVRWARARSRDELAALEAVLAEFFIEVDGRFTQNRVEEELAQFRIRQETNRELGAKGGAAKSKRNAKPIASEPLSETVAKEVSPPLEESKPSHKPLATSHEEAKKKGRGKAAPPCPDDVAEQVWQDWLTLRRAKNAPVTETVLTSARREAEAAGMPLERFLAVWCNRGSQGLEASWLKPHERAGPSGQSQPSRQAQGVAAILGVNAHDLIADFTRGTLVQGADRNVPCDVVPVEPRRLPGG